MKKARIFPFWLMLLAAIAGCGGHDEPADRNTPGKLTFNIDGTDVEVPLEMMDIFLVEEEDKYTESYEVRGKDVNLVGSFPLSVHVGYGEHFDVLKNQTIDISEEGGERGRESKSTITLPSGDYNVTGGMLIFEKIKKNRLKGHVTLNIEASGSSSTVEGTFEVSAQTWG